MLALPTVLLQHHTLTGSHYDWLIGDPGDPAGRLWTARLAVPPTHWPALRTWPLTPIGAHRRCYLTYQGPLSADRGRVRRIDAGQVVPHLWTPRRIVLQVTLRRFRGRIELRQISAQAWRAHVLSVSCANVRV